MLLKQSNISWNEAQKRPLLYTLRNYKLNSGRVGVDFKLTSKSLEDFISWYKLPYNTSIRSVTTALFGKRKVYVNTEI
jgi:hypothetical protein